MRASLAAALAAAVALLVAGCGVLPGGDKPPPVAVFMLAPASAPGPAPGPASVPAAAGDCPVLSVRPVQPAPGFLTDRMLYVRSASQLEAFAQSQWVDVPARMVNRHVVDRLAAAGIATVVPADAPVAGQHRLSLSGFSLLQRFDGDASAVQLAVDAALFDTGARRQLARQTLAVQEEAGGDARSGVAAAGVALDRLLDELVRFTGDALVAAGATCS